MSKDSLCLQTVPWWEDGSMGFYLISRTEWGSGSTWCSPIDYLIVSRRKLVRISLMGVRSVIWPRKQTGNRFCWQSEETLPMYTHTAGQKIIYPGSWAAASVDRLAAALPFVIYHIQLANCLASLDVNFFIYKIRIVQMSTVKENK